jgi:hypothetical protein
MANDLDLYSNTDIQPYSPSQPLAPAPSPDWGATDVDLLRETNSYTGGGQMVFGQQPLPPGVSIADVQAAFGQMATVFQADFQILGHNPNHIQKASSWLMNAITNPSQQQRQRHRYNLFEHKSDPIFQAFANYAHDQGFSAKFVQDACWWVSEASRRLNAQQVETQAQGSAPNSDAEWDRLEAKALVDKQRCENEMRNRWGREYETRLRVLTHYYANLPQREKDHFEGALLPGDVAALNSPELLEKLYLQAIGGHSLPQGSNLQSEINQIQELIRTNRRAYNNDEALQQRFRRLLELRDGG